jgi:hypothetical protein
LEDKETRLLRRETELQHILKTPAKMSATLPFRDINVHASPSYYAFSSPSSPDAPTLVIDRPTGDIRLSDGKITGGNRVSNIPGILGIIHLKLGMIGQKGWWNQADEVDRQLYHHNRQSLTRRTYQGPSNLPGDCYRILATS